MLWYEELERPRLRPVEAIPHERDGETMVILRDPSRTAQDSLVVPLPTYFLLTLMSGRNSVERIAELFQEQFGLELPAEKIRHIILQLDQSHFLETSRLRAHRESLLQEYRSAAVRKMCYGAAGLIDDPLRFRAFLDGHYIAKGGPGRMPSPGSNGGVRALIAPHIDFHRGGPNYGWAYQALGDGPPPETIVILGTAHAPCETPFILTRQAFETPLGPMPVDTEFIAALEGRARDDFFEEELIHANEHSVEIQAMALRHLYGEERDVRIVPVLCGSLHHEISAGGVEEDCEFDAAVKSLVATITESRRRVTVIAGADLAHVGPQFGDDKPVTDALMAEVHRQDHEALRFAAAGDAAGFLRSFTETNNARRVCSVACIYTLLRCLPALGVKQGRLLNYMQSTDPSGELAVTHASVAYP